MDHELPEKEIKQDIKEKEKIQFYNKPWVRITALILAIVMVFSIWANGAIYIRIRKSHEMDAATNYLVDNTDYVNEDELKRLQEKLLAYQKATELEDYYRLAGTQIAAESYEEALVSIDKCIELYPGGDEELQVDLILKRACLLVLLDQDQDAMLALDQVLTIKPDHADAYLIKAQIYAERGELEPLTDVLGAYMAYKPEEYTIRMVYAQALFELQHFEEAIEQYKSILENPAADVGQGEIRYLLGLTYLQLSNYTASEEALVLARQDNPTLDGLDYYIGICQMAREGYEEAVESFTAAIEAGTMLQHSHYSRGVCLIMAGGSTETALEDLLFASEYTGADADPNVKAQSDDLLAELQGVINTP